MSEPFDPQEPEEGRRGSAYVTRKDVRIIAIVLIVLAILAWPGYRFLLKRVNESLCSRHLHAIGLSMLQYAADNDEHLPFAYERADYESDEIATHNGYAYTWQWAIEPYINNWEVFKCPAAEESEHSGSADPSSGQVRFSDYGMLNAFSGVDLFSISSPGRKVIIGETAKGGANGTQDPLPLHAGGSILKDDGAIIGFDNDQNYPDPKTQFATRLAFPKSATTGFNHDTDGRHPAGIHYLTPDGHLMIGDGATAEVIQLGGSYGRWDVPRPTLRSLPSPGGPTIRSSTKPPTP